MSTVSFSSCQTYRHCHSSQHGSDEEGFCSDGGDIAGYEYLNGSDEEGSCSAAMSTVSFSSCQTYRHCHSSQHGSDEEGSCSDGGDIAGYEYLNGSDEEGSCSDGGDIAGYEYLNGKSSEATMSEDDEDVVDEISSSFTFTAGAADNQVQQRIYGQSQQYVNSIWDDPTKSETPWTDEKHSLYLNSIEEAFVKSMYVRGQFIYSCKTWDSENITTSARRKGLYEDVVPGIENGTKTRMRCDDDEIQNGTKRSSLERICFKQSLQEEDINSGCSIHEK